MPLPNDMQVHYVDSVEKAAELMEWMKQPREVLAYDLETTGLDPRDDGAAIRLAQLGDYTQGWAIPWERWSGVFMEAINSYKGQLVAHNSSFDNRWLRMYADWVIPYDKIDDTMIMAQVCEPDLPAGLKSLSDRHIDRRASYMQKTLDNAMKEQKWGWDTIPVNFEIYWQYGCVDAVITAHLWRHYRNDIATYKTAYDLEMNARRVVSAMEDNGIRIDMEYCETKMKELKDWVEESKDWAKENWGVNISSVPQVVDLFQNRLGQNIERRTASGAPSADKKQMAIFARNTDPTVSATAQFILNVKNADKKANTYFKNFLEFQHDGMLHTSFKTLGARTGRMSSTKPALQTISKTEPVLRDAFLPKNENERLVSIDYNQMELRVLGHFSEDKNLQDAFRLADSTGGDFFVELGKNIYKDPNFHKKDPRRDLTKTALYATIFGAKLKKISESAGVSEEEARSFLSDLHNAYPGIAEFQEKIIRLGDQRERSEGVGYIITAGGRRIPCNKGDSRVLVNYVIQGTSAEITKKALLHLDAAGYTDYLSLVIHDEVIASLPVDSFDEMASEMAELMYVREGFAIEIPCEPSKPLLRWGDKIRNEK